MSTRTPPILSRRPFSWVRRSAIDRRALATLTGLAVVAACAGHTLAPSVPPLAPGLPSLDVLAALIIPTQDVPRKERLSGISGLAYDHQRGVWIAVTDDRLVPRWFVGRFEADGHRLRLDVETPVIAAFPEEVHGKRRVPDFEAVVVLPGGDLLIASEGAREAGQRYPASIMRFARDGSYVSDIDLPDRFLPSVSGGVERGLRDNHGFESLGLSPDGSRLWAIAEAPLLQDDEPATDRRGSRTRLVEFVRQGDTFSAARDLVYPIDRVRIPPSVGESAQLIDQGVSEMAVLPDGTLLSMERAFVIDMGQRRSANIVRLFRLHLDGADDVSGVTSLRQAAGARPIRKELVGDLATVASTLPQVLSMLENFEAMASGPRVAEESSLIVMSDDNFSETQVTAAVLLRLARH